MTDKATIDIEAQPTQAFQHSEALENLSSALCAAQAKMPRVPFDAQNPFLKNKYASLGAVIEASRPILSENGLAICQLPFSTNGTIGVESVLVHKSGEWISRSLSLDLGDEKGKSRAQVAGSIITYLRRYAWASILGLYADEDTDGHQAGSKTHQADLSSKATKTPPGANSGDSRGNLSGPKTEPKAPTEKTREWALEHLHARPGEEAREIVTEFFIKADVLLRDQYGHGEQLEDLPLEYVPTTKAELAELAKAITAFESGEEAKIPYKHPLQPSVPKPQPREITDISQIEVEPAIDPNWQTVQGLVEHVSLKEGTSAKGPWSLWGIKIGGEWHNTFSNRIGHAAQEAHKAKRRVTLYFSEGEKGKVAEEIE